MFQEDALADAPITKSYVAQQILIEHAIRLPNSLLRYRLSDLNWETLIFT